ncbi:MULTISPECIES: methyl-accepting chemotaxis protein [unclassified Salinivibrio]|uniref:methyl-accepting chemotaxis protein n=1 Tax=unclassified Salinivibrio TaxID=2636825 RepID=UPI00128BD609|nr:MULTISPECIES: methyl-accepting chemotaxis protein [unclassified Salinivibrio]MPS32468.1 methyl-accepting chemotaxis protein [Salinivibrio sp. VYel7]MPX90609.1 methyl-accepting chemotaxis protein [Salinivibrio sp. VYel1]MPX93861.1 methyl-accepting chemotaxis protein [Salinivibrio sp. VYel9]MPX96098.1 methyl-accepting chemotaxis protein [Salinivibrio sp. VYel6]MPY00326.1 methyl-accepting chemotaxis protein [Salinivibrio sp. VYel4]
MRSLSIQWKVTLVASLCVAVTAVTLLTFSTYVNNQFQQTVGQASTQTLRSAAQRLATSQAQVQATHVQRSLDEAVYRAQMLAQSVVYLQYNAEQNFTDSGELRGSINELVRRSVENFDTVQAAFVVFKPNALDQEDDFYQLDTERGANAAGRFASRWQKRDGELQGTVLSEKQINNGNKNGNGQAANHWYQCPLNQGAACVSAPKQAGSSLSVTISSPLMRDGQVLGVLGIDIALGGLQSVISEADKALFDGAGNVSVLSQGGRLVASDNAQVSGGTVDDLSTSPDAMSSWLMQGQPQTVWEKSQLMTYVPIALPGTTWGALITLPEDVLLSEANQLSQQITAQRSQAAWTERSLGVVATLLALVIAGLAARQIVKPLKLLAERLAEIADGDGDLTQRIQLKNRDEIGVLAGRFNRFLDKLQPIMANVINSVEEAEHTAKEAARVAVQTRDGSREQVSSLDAVATASEEMTQTASQVASHTESALTAATAVNTATEKGEKIVTGSSQAMTRLVETLNGATHDAQTLQKSSQDITEILTVIDTMSEQTNLLALNAAIEAARAGEQGRGFAVVADEVRELSQRTNQSITQIRTVIDSLQSGAESVVAAIHEGNQLADDTAEKVQETVASLDQIRTAMQDMMGLNSEISAAAEQQSAVSGDVTQNVTHIRERSDELLSHAESAASIASQLEALAGRQRALTAQFKV